MRSIELGNVRVTGLGNRVEREITVREPAFGKAHNLEMSCAEANSPRSIAARISGYSFKYQSGIDLYVIRHSVFEVSMFVVMSLLHSARHRSRSPASTSGYLSRYQFSSIFDARQYRLHAKHKKVAIYDDIIVVNRFDDLGI